ncbi:hypothetical protein [Leisingera methylohalidivorans]|uniref:hypothetical protein n=1 Tax=Leisingera methylohalidivorans TaxID=133924 RepID=UPI001A7EA7D5|nr:hypothetical protein [Leisingera methylohalidivorans]
MADGIHGIHGISGRIGPDFGFGNLRGRATTDADAVGRSITARGAFGPFGVDFH